VFESGDIFWHVPSVCADTWVTSRIFLTCSEILWGHFDDILNVVLIFFWHVLKTLLVQLTSAQAKSNFCHRRAVIPNQVFYRFREGGRTPTFVRGAMHVITQRWSFDTELLAGFPYAHACLAGSDSFVHAGPFCFVKFRREPSKNSWIYHERNFDNLQQIFYFRALFFGAARASWNNWSEPNSEPPSNDALFLTQNKLFLLPNMLTTRNVA